MTDNFFATAQKCKDTANLSKVPNAIFENQFEIARIEVIDFITESVYDAIFSAKTEAKTIDGVDYTPSDYKNVELAETYLVLKNATPSINTSSTGDGITKASGTGDNRQENLSESDIKIICDRYDEKAMKLLRRYIPKVDKDEDGNTDSVITSKIQMFCP